jgi:hypothetical protein
MSWNGLALVALLGSPRLWAHLMPYPKVMGREALTSPGQFLDFC